MATDAKMMPPGERWPELKLCSPLRGLPGTRYPFKPILKVTAARAACAIDLRPMSLVTADPVSFT